MRIDGTIHRRNIVLERSTSCSKACTNPRLIASAPVSQTLSSASASSGFPLHSLDVCGLQLALYLAMRDQRVNNSELARRLGVYERVVRRMLDPQYATKAEKIQAALAVLGKQMTVEVRDAA